MACSAQQSTAFLAFLGFFFPLVDISMLLLGDDVFLLFVHVLPIFLYIALFV
jgi:hypothetical protein